LVFFKQFYPLLFKSVILEWAKFLEKINKSLPKLISKIENEDVPRTSLKKYEKVLTPFFKNCFYYDDLLEYKKTHVDHFIPRVYIREDEIWNLVLSCKDCNCVKLGSLAPKTFRDNLIQRNKNFQIKINGLEKSLQMLDLGYGFEKVIEDHYDNANKQGYEILPKEVFKR